MTVREAEGTEESREQMVQALIDMGAARSPEVVAAFRAVPRHLVEGADPDRVYDARKAVVTKTGPDGVNISSVSGAQVQAMQIEQACLLPGHRVLEVGSGGVNAAYLAELVGPTGQVVTMDIDPDVTARATAFLSAAGYGDVVVVTGDAAFGVSQHAPFDRVVVTVETTDIPPSWWEQLADGGRIVAPLRWRGLTRTVALIREGDSLVADDIAQCGFVPMQGAGEERQRLVVLNDEQDARVVLRVDGADEFDAVGLTTALRGEKTYLWTGVTLTRGGSYEQLDLWLATVLDTVVLTGDPGASSAGLIASATPIGIPVLAEGASFAYRTIRATDDPQQWELGVIGHGPDASSIAERYAMAIQAWSPERAPHLVATRERMHGDAAPSCRTVERRHTSFTISWS